MFSPGIQSFPKKFPKSEAIALVHVTNTADTAMFFRVHFYEGLQDSLLSEALLRYHRWIKLHHLIEMKKKVKHLAK